MCSCMYMHTHTHTLALHDTKKCVCAPDKRQAEYEGVGSHRVKTEKIF